MISQTASETSTALAVLRDAIASTNLTGSISGEQETDLLAARPAAVTLLQQLSSEAEVAPGSQPTVTYQGVVLTASALAQKVKWQVENGTIGAAEIDNAITAVTNVRFDYQAAGL